MSIPKKKVFVVDDEKSVLKSVEETLLTLDVEVTCFDNPVECLERLLSKKCDLLIADLKMPEMDGFELLANVKRRIPWVPVFVVTGFGDIPTAVQAIKAGAEDFIEKPLNKGTLLYMVKLILEDNKSAKTTAGNSLTPTQKKVLTLIVKGNSNKEIADLLNRSVRTIEVHRSHLMEKLGVRNMLELIKKALALGLVDLPARQNTEKR